jgi:FtsH-binding integral membrane protein
MIIVGHILLAFGLVAGIVGDVMFLTVAYKRSLVWFFACLFVPIVCWLFFFLNMKATIKPFLLQVLGLLLAGVGCYMAGIIWPSP